MTVRWHSDDGDEWYGWTSDQDMSEEPPKFLVKETPDETWAGWLYLADGSRTCITADHTGLRGACREIEEGE